MMSERKPVFFTSVPKCGKNLVYSFYFELGLKRWNWGDAPATLQQAFFARFAGRQSYVFPNVGPVSDEVSGAALASVISQLGAMPVDTIAHNHFLPEPDLIRFIAQEGVPSIFVYRDPRDALLSMLNFARTKQTPKHVSEMLGGLSDGDALLFLLEGGGKLVPFADYFDAYHGWLSAPGVKLLRFEDLVGARGGGDNERQLEACEALGRLAGLAADDPRISAAREKVFNVQAGTFFRGQIGAWREGLPPLIQRRFETEAGWLLPRWGYA